MKNNEGGGGGQSPRFLQINLKMFNNYMSGDDFSK
jgi:hypothetical protein